MLSNESCQEISIGKFKIKDVRMD